MRPSRGRSANHRRTRIKLCGVTSVDEMDFAIAAGVDAIGLVFSRSSPRYVLPHTAMQIARRLPPFVSAIGVFENPSDPDLMVWPGRWVQLTGQEDEPQMQRVARLRQIVKGFPFDAVQLRRWDRCAVVGAMLVQMPPPDSQSDGAWSQALQELAAAVSTLHTPIIMGGELTPETAAESVRQVHPHGIDIADTDDRTPARLCEFVQAVREAESSR